MCSISGRATRFASNRTTPASVEAAARILPRKTSWDKASRSPRSRLTCKREGGMIGRISARGPMRLTARAGLAAAVGALILWGGAVDAGVVVRQQANGFAGEGQERGWSLQDMWVGE